MKKLLLTIFLFFIYSSCFGGAGMVGLLGNSDTPAGGGGNVGSIDHASTKFIAASSTVYMSPGTASAGTAQYAHIYYTGGTVRTVCVSVKNSSGTVIANGSGSSEGSAGWGTIDVGSFELAAVTYHTAISSSGALTIGAATGGTTQTQGTTTCDVSEAIPGTTDTKLLAIYFDNNAGDPE